VPPPVKLVIFDCDGVLVDSELLSAGVLMAMLKDVGLAISPEIFRSDFLGRSFASASALVERRFRRPLPEDFQMRYRKQLLEKMRGNLKAMPGIEDVLITMALPFCLATSSSPERLAVTLDETGLGRWFEGACFTASLVANGKPAPDLLLHACRTMGVAPGHCLVIEDSEMGVAAANNAGMRVWHFAGGSHMANGYRLPDGLSVERALDSMAALLAAFRAIGVCK
jgi:HAD superfamily hydrolase (TIGR01509 family)